MPHNSSFNLHPSVIQTHSKPVIEHCYRDFLLQNYDPDEREYPDAADQIREVLIHENYLSQEDIGICLGFDLAGIADRPEIVGNEIGNITRPLAFTGEKARRLLVFADAAFTPPWGGWSYLSKQETERRTFAHFRAAINKAIAPHEVDHIDFTTDENAEQGAPADAKKPRR